MPPSRPRSHRSSSYDVYSTRYAYSDGSLQATAVRPWQLIDSGRLPQAGGDLRLYQRDDEFAIKVDGTPLMNSRMHGSEEALAELGCRMAASHEQASVLVGGLGMGYTLAAALKQLGPSAEVEVAELAALVVDWNRTFLAHLAGAPLQDPRVTLYQGDIADRLKGAQQRYDAILLDVDNGPEGLTQRDNNWLYSEVGLKAARCVLKPGGTLAVWSEGASPLFTKRLRRIGFRVEEARPRFHGRGRGGRHTIWLATRAD